MKLVLSRDGASATREFGIPALDIPKSPLAAGAVSVWTESPMVAVTPLTSLRLANVRDGVQDYELMKLAEAKAGRGAVLDVVRRIAPNQSGIVRDRKALLAARVELIRLACSRGDGS
ncbi:MAG: DUF4091 domain-containing protein [Kiritimatiellae bacterium]|nr:DUF4091 domain-containing protein [Kiritimatiellia bacterium]